MSKSNLPVIKLRTEFFGSVNGIIHRYPLLEVQKHQTEANFAISEAKKKGKRATLGECKGNY